MRNIYCILMSADLDCTFGCKGTFGQRSAKNFDSFEKKKNMHGFGFKLPNTTLIASALLTYSDIDSFCMEFEVYASHAKDQKIAHKEINKAMTSRVCC